MDKKTEAVAKLLRAMKQVNGDYARLVYDPPGPLLDMIEDAIRSYEQSRMDSTVDRLHEELNSGGLRNPEYDGTMGIFEGYGGLCNEALNAPYGKCGHCHKAPATHFCRECEEPCCPTCHCRTREELTNEQP